MGSSCICILSLFPPDQVLALPCKPLIQVLERKQDVETVFWDIDKGQRKGRPSPAPEQGLPGAWYPASAYNLTILTPWPRGVVVSLGHVGVAIGHRALRQGTWQGVEDP